MKLHPEAEIRLVAAVIAHRLIVGHPEEGSMELLAEDGLEEVLGHSLEGVEHIVALHEGHLAIDLGELGLAVGAQVLIAKALHDLQIAIEAGYHQQLLE